MRSVNAKSFVVILDTGHVRESKIKCIDLTLKQWPMKTDIPNVQALES